MPALDGPKIVLIGGASHTGKSTLCAALTARAGWSSLSTDSLGRHPGRPWATTERAVPEHVARHYMSFSAGELADDVLRYQQAMWLTLERVISRRLQDETMPRLAFEGSALLPENLAAVADERVFAVCLSAEAAVLERRIHESSQYESATDDARHLIDKFVGRNRLLNERYAEMAGRCDVRVVDTSSDIGVERLVASVLPPGLGGS